MSGRPLPSTLGGCYITLQYNKSNVRLVLLSVVTTKSYFRYLPYEYVYDTTVRIILKVRIIADACAVPGLVSGTQLLWCCSRQTWPTNAVCSPALTTRGLALREACEGLCCCSAAMFTGPHGLCCVCGWFVGPCARKRYTGGHYESVHRKVSCA